MREFKKEIICVAIAWILAIACPMAKGKEADMRQLNISVEITDEQYMAISRRAARIGGKSWTVADEIRTTAAASIILAADDEIRREIGAVEKSTIARDDIFYDNTPIRVVPARKEVEAVTPTLSEDPSGEPVAFTNDSIDRTDINITESGLDLFQRCVQAEAGNQSIEGKTAAAEAIRNRMMRPEWPNTVEEVIAQGGQFTVWTTGTIWSADPDEETIMAVANALAGSTTIPEDYVFFNTSPIGRDCIKIGDHYFGR